MKSGLAEANALKKLLLTLILTLSLNVGSTTALVVDACLARPWGGECEEPGSEWAEAAALQLPRLPSLHRDPFDRVLVWPIPYAMMSWITCPLTSVSRKSRPLYL